MIPDRIIYDMPGLEKFEAMPNYAIAPEHVQAEPKVQTKMDEYCHIETTLQNEPTPKVKHDESKHTRQSKLFPLIEAKPIFL